MIGKRLKNKRMERRRGEYYHQYPNWKNRIWDF